MPEINPCKCNFIQKTMIKAKSKCAVKINTHNKHLGTIVISSVSDLSVFLYQLHISTLLHKLTATSNRIKA